MAERVVVSRTRRPERVVDGRDFAFTQQLLLPWLEAGSAPIS